MTESSVNVARTSEAFVIKKTKIKFAMFFQDFFLVIRLLLLKQIHRSDSDSFKIRV